VGAAADPGTTVKPAHRALDEAFRENRSLLWGISYRLTGCAADAEDVLQETFARALEQRSLARGEDWRPWLVRVATNRSLDLLRRRRRTAYAGAWLPSPVTTGGAELEWQPGDAESTESRYERRESLSFAFLLALEALTPRQRAVLLLRDVIGFSARETAGALAVSEESVRITHLRARRAMEGYDSARCVPTEPLADAMRKALAELVRCLVTQDADGLTALLCDSVRTITDGGGEYNALHAPLEGRERVALLHLRVARRRAGGARIEIRDLNGLPALVIEYASAERRQAPRTVLRCELAADGRIREIHSVLASRKLTAVDFGTAASRA
jgi:RNA polymerase sigma factor (sigma-70 family)